MLKLDVPGVEPLVGRGVYYGAARSEAFSCVDDDVFVIGGANSDDHDAEGGDDIMVGSPGVTDRYHGMYGFDYVTYDGTSTGIDADLNFNLLQPPDVTAIRDRFTQVESLSGGSGDDVIRGLGIAPDDLDADAVNKMDPENLDLVTGLRELLSPAGHEQDYSMRVRSDNPLLQDTDGVSNLLFGGAGDDIMEGRFGDDFIDGDRALRVRLVHTPRPQARPLDPRYAGDGDHTGFADGFPVLLTTQRLQTAGA